MLQPTIVVVGNGMVGYKFCEKLVAKSSAFQIIVFGEEPRRAYDRVHLSEYFAGKSADDLSMSSASWYADHDIELYLGDPIQEINRQNKTIHSLKGITCSMITWCWPPAHRPLCPICRGLKKRVCLFIVPLKIWS
jgi:nitrite reductase (NADH) large subunit